MLNDNKRKSKLFFEVTPKIFIRIYLTLVKQVIKGTTGLLQSTERISTAATEVSIRQSSLMQHATAVLDMLHGLIGRSLVSTTVCEGISDCPELAHEHCSHPECRTHPQNALRVQLQRDTR